MGVVKCFAGFPFSFLPLLLGIKEGRRKVFLSADVHGQGTKGGFAELHDLLLNKEQKGRPEFAVSFPSH